MVANDRNSDEKVSLMVPTTMEVYLACSNIL